MLQKVAGALNQKVEIKFSAIAEIEQLSPEQQDAIALTSL
jgi:hypothetical protein